jgi:ketosteroid isomerase-like protein
MTDSIESLLAANDAYYRAFASRDLAAMQALWADEGISCVHPGWLALIGQQAVLASFRDIFRNARQETVEYRDTATLVQGDDGRVFCVESVGGALLLATNWFRRIDDHWRMVHHQASPLATSRQEPRSTRH